MKKEEKNDNFWKIRANIILHNAKMMLPFPLREKYKDIEFVVE